MSPSVPPDALGPWKARVAARFSAAAADYDAGASVQQQIAHALAATIAAQPLPGAPRVAEIGCGTGFLTAALWPRLKGCHWLATDVAAPMLAATTARLQAPATLTTKLMDGEQPTLEAASWDLVCSSLATQWFVDLGSGLGRLYDALAPGGLLAVATLGAETFAPWAAACRAEGLGSFAERYPTAQTLAADCPGATVTATDWPLAMQQRSPAAFLAALRCIGADTPPPGQTRTPVSALRRALRRLNKGNGGGYQVLTVLWRKPPHRSE
jgi:malonyl-CoA O-methyltransferase